MRFSRVVDALDASGGKFENVYMYVCYVQRRVSCTSYHALRVLCPFSCLHFLSSVVVEISSFSFFFFFCFLSHLLLLSSISKFKQPMTYIWKGEEEEEKTRVKYILLVNFEPCCVGLPLLICYFVLYIFRKIDIIIILRLFENND